MTHRPIDRPYDRRRSYSHHSNVHVRTNYSIRERTPEIDPIDPIDRSGAVGNGRATTRRTRRWTRAMALNREFYAACFARSALGRTVATETKSSETSFAAAAKKEFDLTSFLKDLAAVRARDATRRGWARAIASG